VCARCSDYKAKLQYNGNRLNRVCQECYIFLTGHVVLEDREGKHKGILEVSSARLPRALLLRPASSELCCPPWPPALLSQLGRVRESLPQRVPANGEAGGHAKPPPSHSTSLGTGYPRLRPPPDHSRTLAARAVPRLSLIWGHFVEWAGSSPGNNLCSVPFLPPALGVKGFVRWVFFGRKEPRRSRAGVCCAVPCSCWTGAARGARGAGS